MLRAQAESARSDMTDPQLDERTRAVDAVHECSPDTEGYTSSVPHATPAGAQAGSSHDKHEEQSQSQRQAAQKGGHEAEPGDGESKDEHQDTQKDDQEVSTAEGAVEKSDMPSNPSALAPELSDASVKRHQASASVRAGSPATANSPHDDALPAVPAPEEACRGVSAAHEPARDREGDESPLSILSSMFPDLPQETVADVLAAVGNADAAVQILLSFSSTTVADADAVGGESQVARDAALAHAIMAEDRATSRSAFSTTYDASRLPYQPRVRRAPRFEAQAGPEHAHGEEDGPDWVGELDKFADTASRAAEGVSASS